MFEPRNKEINVNKIIAVKDTTYAAAKGKPEKFQACQDPNPDLCDTAPVQRPSQLS